MSRASVISVRLIRSQAPRQPEEDLVAAEEPMEIRLEHGPKSERSELKLAVTMRTPGNDLELALGFLFAEAIISSKDDVHNIYYCENVSPEETGNVVKVILGPEVVIRPASLQRHFYTSSSCGVCGKTSLEAVMGTCEMVSSDLKLPASRVLQAPDELRDAQLVFQHTGGLHAAGLFNGSGELLVLREDVGRHNALDKLIGATLGTMENFSNTFLVLSGRSSFELIQKAGRAGIPVVIAVGAPSSLAVNLADKLGITLAGFARKGSFNCYTHCQRISFEE